MKVLVTGGCGYIGGTVSHFLAEKKIDLVIVDNLGNGHKEALPEKAIFYKTNLCNQPGLDAVFSKEKPDAVLHFAGYIQVGESVQNPLKYYHNNISCTTSLLQSMIKHDCKQIVFSSTAAVYGNPVHIPITETDALKPINPYGHTKLISEQMIQDTSKAHGIKFAILRYFNAAGAGFDTGESHFPETHLIPNILSSAQQAKPFSVFGTDYPTRDGTCIRDYIHVLDLARAHYQALLYTKSKSDFFNLGSNKGYSVLEIIKEAEKVVGKPINFQKKSKRAGDPPQLIASNTKAKKKLNWKPNESLHTILESAWNWQKNRKY